MAAETLTQTQTTIKSVSGSKDNVLNIVKLAIVTDTEDGSCSISTTDKLTGKLLQIITDPGSPAPDANYDIVLNHATYGHDVAGGALANRHTTSTEMTWPQDGATNNITHGIWLDNTLLTVVATSNTQAGAKFDIYLFIEK